MEERLSDILEKVIKASIVLLTITLVWFSMVYYPRLVGQLKNQPGGRHLIGVVNAGSRALPYDSGNFRIEYRAASNLYIVVVNARTVEGYGQFRDDAQMTLKNILSLDSLCGLNVVYASSMPLASVPEDMAGSCS